MVAGTGIGGPTTAALAVAFSDAPYPPAFAEPPSRDFGGSSSVLRYVDDGASALNDQGSDRCYLTPLLTPLRAQYGETAGNREQRKRLRYADFATYGNAQKQVSADCGSESTEVGRMGTRGEQGG
jgi:hypothetical protein